MATVTRTYLVDDLDNSTEDVKTVRFNAEGTNYEIDLSAANAERLRAKLARFVDAAHPVKAPAVATAKRRGRGKATVVSTKQQTQEIREWAKQAGTPLGVSKVQLHDDMKERGVLASSDPGRTTVRRDVSGIRSKRVLQLSAYQFENYGQ